MAKMETSAEREARCSLSEIIQALSVAAACSSKMEGTQKRLRRAEAPALLMRARKEQITKLHAPLSSKKRIGG